MDGAFSIPLKATVTKEEVTNITTESAVTWEESGSTHKASLKTNGSGSVIYHVGATLIHHGAYKTHFGILLESDREWFIGRVRGKILLVHHLGNRIKFEVHDSVAAAAAELPRVYGGQPSWHRIVTRATGRSNAAVWRFAGAEILTKLASLDYSSAYVSQDVFCREGGEGTNCCGLLRHMYNLLKVEYTLASRMIFTQENLSEEFRQSPNSDELKRDKLRVKEFYDAFYTEVAAHLPTTATPRVQARVARTAGQLRQNVSIDEERSGGIVAAEPEGSWFSQGDFQEFRGKRIDVSEEWHTASVDILLALADICIGKGMLRDTIDTFCNLIQISKADADTNEWLSKVFSVARVRNKLAEIPLKIVVEKEDDNAGMPTDEDSDDEAAGHSYSHEQSDREAE